MSGTVRDRIAEQEQGSALSRIENQQSQLLETIEGLTSAQAEMRSSLTSLTTSQMRGGGPGNASQNEGVERTLSELKSELGKQGKRLDQMSPVMKDLLELLGQSEAVRLPDGSTVRRSDVDAHSLSKGTNQKIEDLSSAVEVLVKEVRRKSSVRLDETKVVEGMTGRLAAAFEARMDVVLRAQEERLESVGAVRADSAVAALGRAQRSLEAVERRAAGLDRSLGWHGLGRTAAALLPFAMVSLALATLLGLTGQVLGVDALLGWAWDSFTAASTWWGKALIAVGTLSGTAALLWLVKVAGGWLTDAYRGWR